MGGICVAVTSKKEKEKELREMGAEEVVVVKRGEEFHKTIKEKCDVCLENVGLPTFNSSLRSLKPGGRLVVIGNVQLGRVELNLGSLFSFFFN